MPRPRLVAPLFGHPHSHKDERIMCGTMHSGWFMPTMPRRALGSTAKGVYLNVFL